MSEIIEKVKASIRHDVFKGISFDFTGKVALVTGARSGICLATAQNPEDPIFHSRPPVKSKNQSGVFSEVSVHSYANKKIQD